MSEPRLEARASQADRSEHLHRASGPRLALFLPIALPRALALLLASGCGPTRYVCPDPVGPIVRDDCSVYETQYESLAVSLSASIGPAQVSAGAGMQRLRDPGELLQLLRQQTLALCKDFNTCRIQPLEYRRRREEADRKHTAILAIHEQMKQTTDAEARRRLTTALIDAISVGLAPPRPVGKPAGTDCRSDNECAVGLGCCHRCTSGEHERVPGASHVRYVPGRALPWGRCDRVCFPCR